jgi:phage host-nuclease inhibitor protein Gam
MSNTRIKKSLTIAIASRSEAEQVINEMAVLANEVAGLKAEMDAHIIAEKERYSPLITSRESQLEQRAADLEAWAIAHPDEFGKKKSIDFLNGSLGFRTGTPKLSLLNRKWTWETVTDAVSRLLPNFIRSKPEVDKAGIIAQADELEEFLPQVGLKVTQGESFFVEPKITTLEKN